MHNGQSCCYILQLASAQVHLQLHRLQNGQDEGRDAFKSLKNQQIADKAALLYIQWAELESKTGTYQKLLYRAGAAHCALSAPSALLVTVTLTGKYAQRHTWRMAVSCAFLCTCILFYQAMHAQNWQRGFWLL